MEGLPRGRVRDLLAPSAAIALFPPTQDYDWTREKRGRGSLPYSPLQTSTCEGAVARVLYKRGLCIGYRITSKEHGEMSMKPLSRYPCCALRLWSVHGRREVVYYSRLRLFVTRPPLCPCIFLLSVSVAATTRQTWLVADYSQARVGGIDPKSGDEMLHRYRVHLFEGLVPGGGRSPLVIPR